MELRSILALVRKWLWLLVLAIFIGGAAGFVVNFLQPKSYESDTTLLIVSPNHGDNSSLLGNQQEAQAFALMPQSALVLRATIQTLGDNTLSVTQLASMVTLSNDRSTQYMTIGVRDHDPVRATRLATIIAEQSMAQFQAAVNNNDTLQFMQEEMDRIETEIKNLQLELANVQAEPSPDPLVQANRISRLNASLGELQLAYSQLTTNYESGVQIRVIRPAVVPTQPVGSGPNLAIAIGMLAGLLGIAGVILFIEQSDDTLRTPEIVRRATGLQVMVAVKRIPQLTQQKAWLNGHQEHVEAMGKPLLTVGEKNPFQGNDLMVKDSLKNNKRGMESDDTVRLERPVTLIKPSVTSVEEDLKKDEHSRFQLPESFLALGILLQKDNIGSLLITSPNGNEGKTTIATQTAVGLARVGIEVVLIDANLRKPNIHTIFGLSNRTGLSTLLSASEASFTTIGNNGFLSLLQQTHESHLRVLSGGPAVDSTAELLSSPRMEDLMAQLSQKAVVVLDSSAVLSTSETLILSRKSDAVLMVVDARSTSSIELKRSLEILAQVNTRILGIALNQMTKQD